MIAETIRYWPVDDKDAKVLLVTDDGNLRLAVEEFKHADIRVVKKIEDVLSEIQLILERETEEFAEAAIKGAPLAFYSRENPNCLWNEAKIEQKIKEEYPTEFLDIAMAPQKRSLLEPIALGTPSAYFLDPIDAESTFFWSTSFLPTKDGRYHWNSEVEFTRPFREQTLSKYGNYPQVYVRIAKFRVHWSCEISTHGKFSKLRYEGTTRLEKSLVKADLRVASKYNIPIHLLYGFSYGPEVEAFQQHVALSEIPRKLESPPSDDEAAAD